MITEKQIAAIKYLIFKDKRPNSLSKQLLAFLLDKSELMTKEVCVTLYPEVNGFSDEDPSKCADDVHSMTSSNGTLFIDAIMAAVGTEFRFTFHCGFFVQGKGLIIPDDHSDKPSSYTIWLALKDYSKSAALIELKHADLKKIDLHRPGLHPGLEKQDHWTTAPS